jgi:hypothetical protein
VPPAPSIHFVSHCFLSHCVSQFQQFNAAVFSDHHGSPSKDTKAAAGVRSASDDANSSTAPRQRLRSMRATSQCVPSPHVRTTGLRTLPSPPGVRQVRVRVELSSTFTPHTTTQVSSPSCAAPPIRQPSSDSRLTARSLVRRRRLPSEALKQRAKEEVRKNLSISEAAASRESPSEGAHGGARDDGSTMGHISEHSDAADTQAEIRYVFVGFPRAAAPKVQCRCSRLGR